MWSGLSSLVTIDTIKPTVELKQFNRINNDTVKITFTTNDNLSGVESGHLQIANTPDFDAPLIDQTININTNSYQITGISSNGALYARLSVADKAGNESGHTVPKVIEVTAPVLIQPATKSTIKTASLNI